MKKLIKAVIKVLIVILFIMYIVKFYKVNKIIELMKKNSEFENYYFDDHSLIKKRNKNIVMIFPSYDSKIYYYYDFDATDKKYYIIDIDNKTYYKEDITESDYDLLDFPLYNYLTSDYSLLNKISLVFDWKINDYDNDRYEIITKQNDRVIFDKNTGFILRVSNLSLENNFEKDVNDCAVNYVTDEETKFPNLEDYDEEN